MTAAYVHIINFLQLNVNSFLHFKKYPYPTTEYIFWGTKNMKKLKENSELKTALFTVFPQTIPVLTGFLVLGMTYGILMRGIGYKTIWAVLMSAIAFCGSMQFVALTLLTTAFHPLQAFLLSLMVNARHLFYGISMLEKYRGIGNIRYFLIYVLCDETFSISSGIKCPENENKKYYYLAVSLLDYIYWVVGTLLGGVLGDFVFFDTKGMDFALTALFVVLFLEQMKKKGNRPSGITGLIAAGACLFLFGADRFVIPSMIIILTILLLGRGIRCRYPE